MNRHTDSFTSVESDELIDLAAILRELISLAQNGDWDTLTEKTPDLLIVLQKIDQLNFDKKGNSSGTPASQVGNQLDLILRGMTVLSELLEPRKEELKSVLQNSFNTKQLLQKYGP